MIPYTLHRQKRKTIALYVKNGEVEVRAPLKARKREMDAFVREKEAWILEKLAETNARRMEREAFTLHYGDAVLYAGKEVPIMAKPGNRIGFDEKCFYMPPNLNAEHIKTACVQVYRLVAKRDLTNKVLAFARIMGVMPIAVKITGAKTRWGSCSGKKSLNFSWRLIMAEEKVIDYVVVHELAHLTEMNHSDRFWAIVEDAMPDYKERRKRLKALQDRLSREDWE